MQILQKRPDLVVKDLRGNVNTRLKKLENGEYDAIILAYIGLKRLDLLKDIPYFQKLEFMIPPMGQASLGIEIVARDKALRDLAMTLDHKDTHLCSDVERDFIAKIGAGCSAPVAVNATLRGDEVKVKAMLGFANGSNILYEEMSAPRSEAVNLGERLAQSMIQKGALELLKEAEESAFKDIRPQRL